jgi:hypothetical protein
MIQLTMGQAKFKGIMPKPEERNSDFEECAEAVYYDPNPEARAAMRTSNIVSDTWYAGMNEYGKLGFDKGTPEATTIKEDEFIETEGECSLSLNMLDDYNENISIDGSTDVNTGYGQFEDMDAGAAKTFDAC